MRPETVSQTALGTAAGRAIESFRPEDDRLFEDRYAMAFLPRKVRAIVQLVRIPVLGDGLLGIRERQIPGIAGNLLCRTRCIDEAYREALWDGCEQVVILGAGLDSRALRIPAPRLTRIFEVDHPATQAWKRECLDRLDGDNAAKVTLVPVDFERDDLGEALSGAGFRTEVQTLFIWEGVTQYIGEKAVDGTLRWISVTSAPGSRLVFTYIVRGVIDGTAPLPGSERLQSELESRGEPWRFGLDPEGLDGFLTERGFELLEDAGAAEYRARYLEPAGRRMDVFGGERVAVARVRNGNHDKESEWS